MARYCYLLLAISCMVVPTLQVLRYGEPPDLLHVNMDEEQRLANAGIITYNRDSYGDGARSKRDVPNGAGAGADAAAADTKSTSKTNTNSIHQSNKNITTKVGGFSPIANSFYLFIFVRFLRPFVWPLRYCDVVWWCGLGVRVWSALNVSRHYPNRSFNTGVCCLITFSKLFCRWRRSEKVITHMSKFAVRRFILLCLMFVVDAVVRHLCVAVWCITEHRLFIFNAFDIHSARIQTHSFMSAMSSLDDIQIQDFWTKK